MEYTWLKKPQNLWLCNPKSTYLSYIVNGLIFKRAHSSSIFIFLNVFNLNKC